MKKTTYIMLIGLFFSLITPVVVGAEPIQKVASLEQFTTSYFQQKIEQGEVPGAIVSVVQEGDILFTVGVGSSNLEEKLAIDPENTRFRVGSIGKVFTTTAVMQLLDRNRWEAEEINVWDKLSILPNNGIPEHKVSLHHLLTHTSGYDEALINFYTSHPAEVSYREYIRHFQPPIKRTPGVEIEYSNFGMTLLGLWVEDVSKQAFANYVETNIFQPLDMVNSSFVQDEALDQLAVSYYTNAPYPYHYLHMVPAGALTTTAKDMALFMIAHLEHDARLGSAEMYQKMQQTQHRMHELIPGMAYGFYEGQLHGHATLRHEGSVDAFVSELVLIPSEQTGVFVSVNGAQGNETSLVIQEYIEKVTEKLFSELTKESIATVTNSPASAAQLKNISGVYMINRMVESGPLRILNFLQLPTAQVELVDDGHIQVSNIYDPNLKTLYQETEIPLLFQSETTDEQIAFLKDGAQHAFVISSMPQVVLKPTGWNDGRWITVLSIGFIGIVSAGFILLTLFTAIHRLMKKEKDEFGFVRTLLFVQAFSLLMSIAAILLALNHIVYGSFIVAAMLLSVPAIPLLIGIWVIFRKQKSSLLQFASFLLNGSVILLLVLWIWWELTPFHIPF